MKTSFWFVVLFLLSSTVYSENMKLDGSLVYVGQGLYLFDLSSGKSEPIKIMDGLSINEIDKIDAERYLVSVFSLAPSSSRNKVGVYTSSNQNLALILNGSRARYLPNHEKIVFYDHNNNLIAASLADPKHEFVVLDDKPLAYSFPIVKISEDEFLFGSMRKGRYGIWKYNIKTSLIDELSALSGCSLDHAVWRAKSSELFCAERLPDGQRSSKYFLTSLDGKKREMKLSDRTYWPVVYLNDLDALIFQERFSDSLFTGEQHPLYLYQFIGDSKQKISSDALLSSSVVYQKKEYTKNIQDTKL